MDCRYHPVCTSQLLQKGFLNSFALAAFGNVWSKNNRVVHSSHLFDTYFLLNRFLL
jgi:hypothetical protein